MVGGSSFPVMTPDELDTKLDANSLGAEGPLHRLRRDHRDRRPTCIVQFALRVAQFYMHESCGKCTPCRVGTRWLVQILRAVEDGTATENDLERAARRLRPHHRQVPVRARRLGRDAGRELRDEVPRRVPRASRARRLPVRRGLARSRTSSRRSISTRTPPVPRRCIRAALEQRLSSSASRSTSRSARRRRAPGLVETALAAGIEIPVFCYEPRLGAADRRVPHVPRRDRGHAEAAGRLHAHRAGRHGREDGAHVGEGGRGPERDARVHPRQPSARLPRLRQGRRVPAAGSDVPLRPRQDAHELREDDASRSRSRSRRRSRSTASAASSVTAARASARA